MELPKLLPEEKLKKISKVLYYIGIVALLFLIFMWIGGKIGRDGVEIFLLSIVVGFGLIVSGLALTVLAEILSILRGIKNNMKK